MNYNERAEYREWIESVAGSMIRGQIDFSDLYDLSETEKQDIENFIKYGWDE